MNKLKLQTIQIGDLHSRIFKQAVVWVEHFFREKKEPFTSNTAVIESDFTVKFYPEFRLEQLRSGDSVDNSIRIFQYRGSMNFNFKLVWNVGL